MNVTRAVVEDLYAGDHGIMVKIGFLALAAQSFWDTEMADSTFTDEAMTRVREIETALGASHEVVSAGLVTTEKAAVSAASKFEGAGIDALVVCCFMWSEDQTLFRVLDEFEKVPLLIWCWTPGTALPKTMSAVDLIKWSGPVGAQQTTGALRRAGREFAFVLGSHTSKQTLEKIEEYTRAAVVARSLKHSKIGLLPYRYVVMTNTWADEFELMSKLGIDVIHISVGELAASSAAVKDEEIEKYINELRGIRVMREVSSEGLSRAVRASLGLAKIAENLHLSAVSISDLNDELHAVLKCRPCLYLPSVFERGMVVSSEGDLLGTVAELVLARLSGKPVMFTEIFTYDEERNEILVGHAGMHDIRLAENRASVTVTPDYEYPKEEAGVWMYFTVKPGPITLLSIASVRKGFHFVVTRAEALPADGKLRGYPCALVKLQTPLGSFFEKTTTIGTTQHWALVPGDLRRSVTRLASILGLECTVLPEDRVQG